jgi:hypothetical protein
MAQVLDHQQQANLTTNDPRLPYLQALLGDYSFLIIMIIDRDEDNNDMHDVNNDEMHG